MQAKLRVEDFPEGALVSRHCLDRTFRFIASDTGSGSCFTIGRHGRQWLLTANHVAECVTSLSDVVVMGHAEPADIHLVEVARAPRGADIAVYLLDKDPAPHADDLVPTTDEVNPSETVYFLGSPIGLTTPSGDPLVKRAVVSGEAQQPGTDVRYWLLDGMSSPGFSGGPLVRYNPALGAWQAFGVLLGMVTLRLPVQLPLQVPGKPVQFVIGDAGPNVLANIGLFRACRIDIATTAIDEWWASQKTAAAAQRSPDLFSPTQEGHAA